MENEKSCSVTGFVLSFLAGAVVGGSIALLAAPKSGQTTRRQLKKVARDAKAKVEDYYDEVKDKAVEKAQDSYQEVKRMVESTVDAAKKGFQKE